MGPSAGLILADLGAEIMRIEPSPQGDHTRRLKGFGTGYYTFFNRNKKSLSVNLKSGAGLEIVNKLLGTADVLIENFAPGTMDRLGLGYEAVSLRNPRLIYCSLKGFMEGPYVKRTALDEVVQMMSGLAYMTGPPGQPLRAGRIDSRYYGRHVWRDRRYCPRFVSAKKPGMASLYKRACLKRPLSSWVSIWPIQLSARNVCPLCPRASAHGLFTSFLPQAMTSLFSSASPVTSSGKPSARPLSDVTC